MKKELIQKEEGMALDTSNQYSNLMKIAIESNADIDKLERLMELQERWEAKESKKAFFEGLAKFQANCPMIIKKKDGHNYKYAPLGDIQMQIGDLLSQCGLSYRFEQDHDHEVIGITCVASHTGGHTERVRMVAETDTTGSKNAVQARGSTVTYLQRYTLIGSFGIITADEDTDGRLADASMDFITEDQGSEIHELIQIKGADKARFLKFFKVGSIEDIRSSHFTRAVRMLRQKAAVK